MFVDSVDFKLTTCDMKKRKKSLSAAERSSKVTPVVNFIPSKFWSLPQRVSKIVLHTGLNAYRESSGDSRFVTNFILAFFKWSQRRSTSCTNLIFAITFIKVHMCLVPLQNHMEWWWNYIKESPKYKLFDNWKFDKNNFFIWK